MPRSTTAAERSGDGGARRRQTMIRTVTAEQFGHGLGCALLCLCPLAVVIAIAVARGRDGSSSGSTPATRPSSYTAPAPARQRCSCSFGKVRCSCPNGYVYDSSNQPSVHHLCGGTGQIRCLMCDGSGYR